MSSSDVVVDDLFTVQGCILDADKGSVDEKKGVEARAILLKHMAPEQKLRAAIIAAAIFQLCSAI